MSLSSFELDVFKCFEKPLLLLFVNAYSSIFDLGHQLEFVLLVSFHPYFHFNVSRGFVKFAGIYEYIVKDLLVNPRIELYSSSVNLVNKARLPMDRLVEMKLDVLGLDVAHEQLHEIPDVFEQVCHCVVAGKKLFLLNQSRVQHC